MNGCICVRRTFRAVNILYQVIEGLKKVVEYWGDDYLVGRRDFYKDITGFSSSK